MLNFFKRRQRRAQPATRPSADGTDPFAIRDLLEHPALQVVMASGGDVDAPPSLAWARLAAGGPIRFDHPTMLDAVA